MTQSQLDRAVSAVTGESRRTVKNIGFSLANPSNVRFDPEPVPRARFIDWDYVAARRHAQLAVH